MRRKREEEEEEEEEDATRGEVTGINFQRKISTPTPKAREGDRVTAGLDLERDWWQRWDSRPALWLRC